MFPASPSALSPCWDEPFRLLQAEQAPPVFLVDGNGLILRLNEAARQLASEDCPLSEGLSLTASLLWNPEGRTWFESCLAELPSVGRMQGDLWLRGIAGAFSRRAEVRLRWLGGGRQPVRCNPGDRGRHHHSQAS